MTNIDPDDFFAATGIDVKLAGGPDNPSAPPEPALSSAGEQAQAELLHHLAAMRATIEMLELSVLQRPSDDATFDALDGALARSLGEANGALRRLRERRECRGAA